MTPIVRNILAVIAGVVVGGLVNMAIITIGPVLIPLPKGVDMADMEKLAENPASELFGPVLGACIGNARGLMGGGQNGHSTQNDFCL